MYVKKLFILFFGAVIIFTDSKGSAGGHQLNAEKLPDEEGYESCCESMYSDSSEDSITMKEKEEASKLYAQEVERRRKQYLLEWENKKTPLTLAASRGDVQAVQSLLADRADVNQKDGEEWTPLMEAASRSSSNEVVYQAVVRSLLDGRANVHLLDREGRNALMLSVDRQMNDFDEQVVRLLLQAQADVTKEAKNGLTVLHCAIESDDSLFDLLAQAYVGPDQESNERWCKLVAAERGHRERIASLIKHLEGRA